MRQGLYLDLSQRFIPQQSDRDQAFSRPCITMDSFQRVQISRRLLHDVRHQYPRLAEYRLPLFRRPQHRSASTKDPSKSIVLEKPDKFRPPSHPSRLVNSRSRGSTFNGAYNQSSTASEQAAQKTRKYPHMFPEEGTLAYRILTNKNGHVNLALVSRRSSRLANPMC
jgi:hypothetical protein